MENPFIQKVLVVVTLILALGYLVSKYFLPKKKKSDKDCGNGNCGC